MAPSPITEDYNMILEVDQTASLLQIVSSYRRLALKLHPDRNARHDATEAFQRLGLAYETLKDESKRRAYDLIYPSLMRNRPSQDRQKPRPSHASAPQPESLREAAQIAAIQKLKDERSARWHIQKNGFDSSIFELQRGIRRLEQEIKNLDSIIAAEAAAEAQKNSWTTWLLSPLYKKREESEEEKSRRDRERQERRIEKDMKERRLGFTKANLKTKEEMLRKAKEEVDAADASDDRKIRVIRERRLARERMERERLAKIRRQQQEEREKQAREAAEALRKQRAEELAAEQKRRDEEIRKAQQIFEDEMARYREKYNTYSNFTAEGRSTGTRTHQSCTSSCRHDGWWSKVHGRAQCPNCYDSWTYLLQCPGCSIKACPKCQAVIRPRRPRNRARPYGRAPPRVRTPSPNWNYDFDFD